MIEIKTPIIFLQVVLNTNPKTLVTKTHSFCKIMIIKSVAWMTVGNLSSEWPLESWRFSCSWLCSPQSLLVGDQRPRRAWPLGHLNKRTSQTKCFKRAVQ